MIRVCYRGWFYIYIYIYIYIPLSHILLPIIIMYISHPHDLMVGNIPYGLAGSVNDIAIPKL